MKIWTTHKLKALVSAAVFLPAGAWAHPGHEHSADMLAYLVHSITSWGPLLILLVMVVATGYRLRKSRRQ